MLASPLASLAGQFNRFALYWRWPLATWRLIAHHNDPEPQLQAFRNLGCIAIGWGAVGDLRLTCPANAAAITQMVRNAYPTLDNAHLGGPSLWRFFDEMQVEDLVIVSDGQRRRAVMRVTGPYIFTGQVQAAQVGGYPHRRTAVPVALDPDQLWAQCGADVAPGENVRWTLARCG
jgi:hypothetical protein